MKIIYKIHKYYPDTNQISVSFCNLKSREPIDSYKSQGVNCDNLDMFDVESFSESLINQSGLRRVEKQENELDTLSAWMENKNTRAVILDPNALDLGFSWYQEPSGKIWWTLVLGGQT